MNIVNVYFYTFRQAAIVDEVEKYNYSPKIYIINLYNISYHSL